VIIVISVLARVVEFSYNRVRATFTFMYSVLNCEFLNEIRWAIKRQQRVGVESTIMVSRLAAR